MIHAIYHLLARVFRWPLVYTDVSGLDDGRYDDDGWCMHGLPAGDLDSPETAQRIHDWATGG